MKIIIIDEHLKTGDSGGSLLSRWEENALRKATSGTVIFKIPHLTPVPRRIWRIINLIVLNNGHGNFQFYFRIIKYLYHSRREDVIIYVAFSRAYIGALIGSFFGFPVYVRYHNAEAKYYYEYSNAKDFLFDGDYSIRMNIKKRFFIFQSRFSDFVLSRLKITRLFLTKEDMLESVQASRAVDIVLRPPLPIPSVTPTYVSRACVNKTGAMFIGSGRFPPNAASIVRFWREYSSLLIAHDITFYVVGDGYRDIVLQNPELDHPNICFMGYVEDLENFSASMRFMICPIAFGSGIKIKALEALSLGCPVVIEKSAYPGLESFEYVFPYKNQQELSLILKSVSAVNKRHVLEDYRQISRQSYLDFQSIITIKKRKKIAMLDIGSFSLPYDYWYIKRISKNFNVDLYCSNSKYNGHYLDLIARLDGVRVFSFDISSSVAKKFEAFFGYTALVVNLLRRRQEYRFCHLQWPSFIFFHLLMKFIFPSKLILSVHNVFPHNKKQSIIYLNKLRFRWADRLIFISQNGYTVFKENYINHPYSRVVQHGCMKIASRGDKECFPYDYDIIFWGRVSKYKGIDLLTQISHQLKICIVGKWDCTALQLRDKLSYKSIIIDSYLSEELVAEFLEKEGIFVLPYRYINQSGVFYTLLGHAKVVIASDVGDFSDFFRRHNLDALLFDCDDVESFFSAYDYAFRNYHCLKQKFRELSYLYDWDNLIKDSVIYEVYS